MDIHYYVTVQMCTYKLQDISKLYFTMHMVLFTSVDLRGNQLCALPPEVCHLSSVTSLVLDDNQLEQLPPEMKQLANLTTLSLRNNSILSCEDAWLRPVRVNTIPLLNYIILCEFGTSDHLTTFTKLWKQESSFQFLAKVHLCVSEGLHREFPTG